MKLHPDTVLYLNTITAYDTDYLEINGERQHQSVLLHPRQFQLWEIPHSHALNANSLDYFVSSTFEFPLEVVLIGTGRQQHFPPPQYLHKLRQARIGVEIMDTPAACRTYNILMSEGRQVAAALILETADRQELT